LSTSESKAQINEHRLHKKNEEDHVLQRRTYAHPSTELNIHVGKYVVVARNGVESACPKKPRKKRQKQKGTEPSDQH